MLYLVKADGDNLVVPNCKKSKWLNAKIIVTKAGTLFQCYTLLFLVRGVNLKVFSHLILNNSLQGYFDTNLVKIHSAVIEILSFSCSALLLVTVNGGYLGMPNCKKIKRLHTRNILAQSWINTNQWFLRYHHFHV